MVITWKYALVAGLALASIYLCAPLAFGGFPRLPWLDEINVVVDKSLALAKPKAVVPPVDPIAAANVDEDLDYRIAQRMNSTEGWRSFLTAHPDGPHAQAARADLDTLVAAETAPAPIAAEAPDRGPPEIQAASEAAAPAGPSPSPEAATAAADESCRLDQDRLEQLSMSPTGDGIVRFLIDLRCEKLRPELLRLAKRVDAEAPPAAAVAAQEPSPGVTTQGPASSASLAPAVSADPPLPPPRWRASEPQNRTHPAASSRSPKPTRHANRWVPSLPPILMALFGGGPKHATPFRRTRAGGGRIRATGPGLGAVASSATSRAASAASAATAGESH